MTVEKLFVLCESVNLGIKYMAGKFKVPPLSPALQYVTNPEQMRGRRDCIYINAIHHLGPYGRSLLEMALVLGWEEVTNCNVGTIQELVADPAMIPYFADHLILFKDQLSGDASRARNDF